MTVERPCIESWLLDVQAIYLERQVSDYRRGREILERFPDAERILVNSDWNIPGLYGYEGNVDDWIRIKRNVLVLGVKSSLSARPNTRSSDFVSPSHANAALWPTRIAMYHAGRALRTRSPSSLILRRFWPTRDGTLYVEARKQNRTRSIQDTASNFRKIPSKQEFPIARFSRWWKLKLRERYVNCRIYRRCGFTSKTACKERMALMCVW